jgi:hypothetical protein
MMHTRLLILVALGALACRPAVNLPLGLQYPPLPNGWVEQSGTLIPDSVGGTDYAVSWMNGPAGEYLWFSRALAPDAQGHPRWELRDVLRVPTIGPGRTLVVGECTLAGQRDPEVIAVVKSEDAQWWKTVFSAWRADRNIGRFVVLPTVRIECRNEGYGV